MSETSTGRRIRTLCLDLLLSLVNATLVLVVTALVLLMVVINKAETLQRSVTTAITTEIVEPVRVQALAIKAQLGILNSELQRRRFGSRTGPFDTETDGQTARVVDQLKHLGERFDALSNRVSNSGQIVVTGLLENAAAAFVEALMTRWNCADKLTRNQDSVGLGVPTQSGADARFQGR